jgi:hypothetical protein
LRPTVEEITIMHRRMERNSIDYCTLTTGGFTSAQNRTVTITLFIVTLLLWS